MSPNSTSTQPGSRRRTILLISILLLLPLLIGQYVAEAIAPTPPVTPPKRSADFDRQLADLLTEADSTGRVRVIVGLGVTTQPEGIVTDTAQIAAQRRAIARAQEAVRLRLADLPATISHTYSIVPALAASVDAAGLRALAAAPEVVSIGLDRPLPLLMDQSNAIIGAPAVWSSGYTGAGQTVAVLDTGVDKNHQFLAGQVVAEACFSTADISQGINSLCPGGVASSTAPDSGEDCVGTTGCNHGTHVAGTIAGKETGLIILVHTPVSPELHPVQS